MFCELRQYRVLPGKMDAWLALIAGEFIPIAAVDRSEGARALYERYGLAVVGPELRHRL